MIIRTISNLEKVKTVEDAYLFEASVPVDDSGYLSTSSKYSSNALSAGAISSYVDGGIASKYALLSDNNEPINVEILRETTENILYGDTTFGGSKEFKSSPIVPDISDSTLNKRAVNVNYVNTLVDNKIASAPTYIKPSSTYTIAQTDANTFIDNNGSVLSTTQSIKNAGVMEFNVSAVAPSGYKTNVNSTNAQSSSKEISANATGNLVLYGWMASNSNPATQECWVALEGKINNNWVILQVQPWIIGDRSQYMQYVGFNVPVQKGLYLRIVSGFEVNTGNSGYQSGKTLLYNINNPGTNITNTFIGYVIS